MENKVIYSFQDQDDLEISSQVGGKAYNLIKMTKAGLKVPPGFVLTVEFFSPWVKSLKSKDEWSNFLSCKLDEEFQTSCIVLKNLCMDLEYTNEQKSELIASTHKYLKGFNCFAVRSSSPEEDLESASFAGGYDTLLGINLETLEISIKKVFASSLNFRIFKYKKEKGLSTLDFRIAIIIMAQIASEISGVAFSLNPVTNDYDEIVINSNFGLGETVVAGMVNADHFIINKINRKVVEHRIGKKERAIILNKSGGTEEILLDKSEIKTLDDELLNEIVDQIIKVESYYHRPIDIEWAFKNRIFYLLQARPITSYYELPEIMKTDPNKRKTLYLDCTLVVQGAEKPYSILTGSILNLIYRSAGVKLLGASDACDIKNGVIQNVGGKIYYNLSNLLSKTGKDAFAEYFKPTNQICSEIIKECDNSYVNHVIPDCLNFSKLGMAWRLPIFKLLFPYIFRNKIKNEIVEETKYFFEQNEKLIINYKTGKLLFQNLVEALVDNLTNLLRDNFIPMMVGGVRGGLTNLISLFEPKFEENHLMRSELNELIGSLPNNITNEMGIEIYKISLHLDKTIYNDYNSLKNDFYAKVLSKEFYNNWDDFMVKFGIRGDNELDIKSPRYKEKPELILSQVHNMLINADKDNNPMSRFEKTEKNRPYLYQKFLEEAKSSKFENEFKRSYELCYNLAGFRESPKYCIISIMSSLRKIVLEFAEIMFRNNLLEHPDKIFDLTIENISKMINPNTYVQKSEIDKFIFENSKIRNIFMKWNKSPQMIDSRGRILSNKPKPIKPGELAGLSVSYGTVTGRVKVLNFINEKPFIPGEILVTKATDPGWTPIIINSGGIILEIGGMLQHGGVVSREFGKPCIVGVDNVMSVLKDGELIEVDAVNGIVRKLE